MVFLAGIVLALALVIPAAWFPFQLGKIALFVVLLAITSVMFVVGRGTSDLARSYGLNLALLVGLLPLAYLFSALAAGTSALSITGFGVEVDTVLFTAIAFLAFLLSFGLFKTLRTVRMLVSTIMWTLVALVAFQWIVVVFGTTLVPFSMFADRSVNLVGKWNDFGLLAGLLAVILLVRGDIGRETMVRRIAMGVGFALLVVLLGIVNFALVWWLLFSASLFIGLVTFLTQRSEERAERESNPYAYSSWSQKVPWFSLAGVLISIVFLLYGTGINTELTNRFPVASLEVRPSYSSTYDVISQAREGSGQKSLIGTGPDTFSTLWVMHKPAEVNQSAFWNLDFNVGFSTLVTALGTVGLLGAVAWLIPLFLVLAAVIRAIRLSLLSREERIVALIVGLGSVFLLGTIIFYVPSSNVVLLTFVFAGAAFGYLWRQGRHAQEEVQTSTTQAMVWALMALLVVVSLWSVWGTDRRFIAQAISSQGAVALQAGNADKALAQASRSQAVETTNDNLRLGVEAGLVQLQKIAGSSDASKPDVQKQFTDTASTTIATAKQLVSTYPNDYRSYVSLGRVYDLLASLKVQGAYESAQQSYLKALNLNPSAPDLALVLARLEASQNKVDLTQKYLSQALTLKPNYTDAILMVVQLNVANNDIPSAIQAAQAAAQTAPGVGPIWFELGLLHYAGGDTKNAIAPFEQAVKIVPDYANAKYFLGLSYYAQGRAADALKEFEDLAKSNPDSQEVVTILNNLRAGKSPFDGAKPTTPTSAPINQ
jgi:tetratricopeptide (TPR) repeat protein